MSLPIASPPPFRVHDGQAERPFSADIPTLGYYGGVVQTFISPFKSSKFFAEDQVAVSAKCFGVFPLSSSLLFFFFFFFLNV
jgi:hypothetical protein